MKDVFLEIKPERLHYWQEPKKGIYVVTLYRNEVEYDVNYALWRFTQSLEQQGPNLDDYELSDDDKSWLDREINTALLNIRRSIAWATTNNHDKMGNNNVTSGIDSYTVTLTFDEPDWRGSIANVSDAMHNYIVNYILTQFFHKKANPQEEASNKQEADKWLRTVHNEVNFYILPPTTIFRL